MEFYYINHTGDRIDLSDYPYRFQSGDILDWTYAYDSSEGVRNRVSNFRKAIKEFSLLRCGMSLMRKSVQSRKCGCWMKTSSYAYQNVNDGWRFGR